MTQSMSFSIDDNLRRGPDKIHSGHFMISQFEADDQEDDEAGEEIIIPEMEETEPNVQSDVNMCTTVQKYNNPDQNKRQLSIETSLTKLFKCMNLTYRQKLTSPKWNSFKGIRLRWKDKIRLNNLIWRCWHMQFIMKKGIMVCQFASPLDTDVHTKPETVVLEGKYWKRKIDVICAEYKKWRRYYRHKALETQSIGDSFSDVDLVEWSNKDNVELMPDSWSTDLLFSPAPKQYSYPDFRDLSRPSRAEFIQPSLEPLQPSFEDVMDFEATIREFLMDSSSTLRLPPVPEEGGDDLLKSIDCNFQMMNSMESPNIIEVPTIQNSNSIIQINNQQQQQQLHYTAKILSQPSAPQSMNVGFDPYNQNNQMSSETMGQMSPPSNIHGKLSYPKGRHRSNISRRQPHNYDKTQPTEHQTNIYHEIMAIQQQQAQEPQRDIFGEQFDDSSNILSMRPSILQQNTNTNFNVPIISNTNILNLSNNSMQQQIHGKYMNQQQQQQQQQINSMQNVQNLIPMLSVNSHQQSPPQQQQQHQQHQQQQLQQQQDSYKARHQLINSPKNESYGKPYSSPQQSTVYKMGQPVTNYSHRSHLKHQSPPHHQQQQQQHISNEQQLQDTTKEMFRSNSLPLNASLQYQKKDDNFAVPMFQAKRTRSNSMVMKQSQFPSGMQSATSEPMLNTNEHTLLAQLLTSSNSNMMSKQSMSSSSLTLQSQQQQQQQQQQHPSFLPVQNQTSSNILSTNSMGVSSKNQTMLTTTVPTPSLSPDSLLDLDSPMSPTRSANKYPRDTQRRAGHIHAEQKRRYNIKNGFDMLHSLIPQLQQNPNAKLSKAAMLQKGADYIRQLCNERSSVTDKTEMLKKERDSLNNSLNHLHAALPANGAPVSRQRTGRVQELYRNYVLSRTQENWKFWIFGLIFEPLLDSFNSTVSVASLEELYRTTMLWVDQHCSLVELRPAVSNRLRYLSTTTDILSDPPSTLQEEVIKAVNKMKNS